MDENKAPEKKTDPNIRTKANAYFFSKVAVNILLILIGAFLIAVLLRNMQVESAMRKQRENGNLALDEAISILKDNEDSAIELTQIFHEGNQRVLDDVEKVLNGGLLDSMVESDDELRAEILGNVTSRAGLDYLFIMGSNGRIIVSSDRSLFGMNPAVSGILTQENVNDVLKGTGNEDGSVSPILVRNRYGSFYFYSKPTYYQGVTYTLAIGEEASLLDDQTSSLKDVGNVLSRAAVMNNGFLFAVSKNDGLFLYYNNGEDLLTGQEAASAGLSEAALKDGYSGTETIKGTKYYCVSKDYDDFTLISAAARTEDVMQDDQFVLFWSVAGFHAIMIICLAYAVIVRNDFVRNAVVTERYTLREHSQNPIYFDISVFKKIFPLMLAGVMAMYGISFYTQTLLEVNEGIEHSNTALREITTRYEESQETRESIQRYHNERFLSTARLISFIIEEDTAFLNEETDHYYMELDGNGHKTYVTDDEGNRLSSVASSAWLRELCDANMIDEIYVYDDDGHTIATSTPNWFFTLSTTEGEQSYPFREVLDGRIDHYIQETMTNDLGEETQYIGVSYHYYTTVDEDGNTRYVSRYAYEKSAAEDGRTDNTTHGGISEHNALIQIELNKSLSAALFASTDVDDILATNMLSGGAVVMFDTTPEHRCVYSPVEAYVGHTAEELKISSRAFIGEEYFGFSRINGAPCFEHFRYLSDYYFASIIPESSMYLARGPISLITAGICFALILILSLTVTLTSKEEEMLYEVMSEADEDLNSTIFNIILPSGKSVSTKKAAARWDNKRIPWSQKNPEQKLFTMIAAVAVLMMIYLIFASLRIGTSLQANSIISYILSGAWDRSPNVFALSACVLVLVATMIILTLFRIPLAIVTSLLGARGETLGHLVISVLKYGGTIGMLFYCLYLIGIDSTNLLAGAGVLSLVIGLGAQSLIKDIIAGIFIVFEGEFRVGDIVTISNFRGTVMDIGLRTTKILAPDGNIKIFNNSEISGVLNMTKETSIASASISIEYGQDIDYVEEVLKRELPLLKDKDPRILDGPDYLGISQLGDSGVSISVIARCSEQDVRGVNRFLNRELLQIFYRNNINVPFPTVTLSNTPEKEAPKKKPARKAKEDAQ
ncbi:MAG: mechanosensitive ion channel [Erysipelotrichaceae bacterium]|nr:mechanosensitive ion channel [Erysipelotrichaceae bacterium]